MNVTLVIPLKNETSTIEILIKSILGQEFQPREIILVDGGSTDNTVQLAKELTKSDSRFSIIEAGNAMPGRGRNIGTAHASFEWIAFTDAGIRLDTQWLKNLVVASEGNPAASIIYGNYSPEHNHFFEKCATIAYVAPALPGTIRGKFIASCLLKKEVWEKAGGFPDWRAAEDLAFMEKADKAGFKVTVAPDAMVYWQLRPGIASTFKRFDLYSKYNVWAGRQALWHYGVARQYAIMLLPALLAIFHSWYWILLIPVWLLARTLKRIFLHRYVFGWKILFNPALLFLVTVITIVVDAATFTGWVKALVNKNGINIFDKTSSQKSDSTTDTIEKLLVSLVIPVYNESKTIADLIASIKAQSFQPDEVILVDGGSTDNTVDIIKTLTSDSKLFKIIEAGRAMPGKGRNIGAVNAKNEWIAFTDAGIKLDIAWLDSLVAKARQHPEISIIYGDYSPQINSFFDKCATICYVPPAKPGTIRGRSTVSVMLKKEVWKKAGGFPDWRAAEDLVFMERAEATGYKMVVAPDAMARWELQPDLSSTFKKFDLYSKFNVWAGRQAYWHYGIARQYAVIVVFVLLGIFHHWWWFLLIPLWLMARSAKRIMLHRSSFGIKSLFNPAVFLMVMLITLVVDIGTFSGWLKALFIKPPENN